VIYYIENGLKTSRIGRNGKRGLGSTMKPAVQNEIGPQK